MAAKTCIKCQRVLDLEEFYKHSPGKLKGECKDCTRKRTIEYQSAHPEETRKRQRRYYRTERGRQGASARTKRWAQANPEKRRATSIATRQRYPEKRKAQIIVMNAIASGKLVREPCWCGKFGEAHHPDYSRPLDVVWLCRLHHAQKHYPIGG